MGTSKATSNEAWETASGLPIDISYGPVSTMPASAGDYPYTRGIHNSMYRGRLWTMRQYAGFGSAEEANQRYRYLLGQGTTGLSVAFDLPTQMGRDSDHALAMGEVGKVGVAISSVDDMRILLNEIPLDRVSISMTINSTAAILLSMLLIVAEERGVAWKSLSGTIQNDVLKEYIARGTYVYPPGPALRIITDIFEFCSGNIPQWNTISISGYHIREAGSTAVEELAFTFCNAITYVEAALKRGLAIDDFAPRLAFFFNCHNDFLEEIAKFRAARKIWAHLMRERFKAQSSKSWMLRFHTQTAGSSLTAQQPLNNIIRTTLQALASVLGGTQSLHTNSFDEALGLPTQESATVALRTQQIIAHESNVAATVDPFGGSYLIEAWTERMVAEVMKMIEKVDSMGGMLRAIESGYPQQEIEQSAYRYQQKVESKKQIVVGVNEFLAPEEVTPPVLRVDPQIEATQLRRLSDYKAQRDKNTLHSALNNLSQGAKGAANLMPLILDALRSRASLGEIADSLRSVFGEYQGQ